LLWEKENEKNHGTEFLGGKIYQMNRLIIVVAAVHCNYVHQMNKQTLVKATV
jgi:hypothetical protein